MNMDRQERSFKNLHSEHCDNFSSSTFILQWTKRPPKGQTKSKWFFQADVSSKKRTNKLYFTTMKPQVDLFPFVFWRKLKTPKRHFEISWPLRMMTYQGTFFHWKQEILGWSLLAWQLSFISSHITAQGFQFFSQLMISQSANITTSVSLVSAPA